MAAVLTRVFSNSSNNLASVQAENETLPDHSADKHRSSKVPNLQTNEHNEAQDINDEMMEVEDEQDASREESGVTGQLELVDDDRMSEASEHHDSIAISQSQRPDSLPRLRKTAERSAITSERSFGEKEQDESQSDQDSESDSSEASSFEEGRWDVTSDGDGDGDDQTEEAEPNRCIFCGEDEEHDPGEEFEDYLSCSICGANAHAHCAREARQSTPEEDARSWICPSCAERDGKSDQVAMPVSKIARNLLPVQRGVIKPDSHSVFSTLILDDDPMDGSRALRKRKASDRSEKPQLDSRKRSRRSQSEVIVLDPNCEPPPGSREAGVIVPGSSSHVDASPRPRSSRAKNTQIETPLVSVVETSTFSLVLCFRCEPSKLANLENERRKRRRRERDRARRARQAEQEVIEVSHYPAIQTSSFTAPLFALQEREGDEVKSKPYGGILSEAEADTTKTFPQVIDRKKFEDARQKAEEEWRRKLATTSTTDHARSSMKVSGPPTKIKCINFGQHEIDTWHAAPYPEEYSRNRVLYICEFCLKYMNSDFVAWRHKLKCPARHPPGDEIYRDGSFSFFEVDGRKNPVYCQNLCLLAKLFLGSKTLYYDVEPFLFYVMTENDDFGCHFVGYFSKEKRPSSQNNVSCILVLPIHQRRGFGHLLIEFSYLLTRVEKKSGSPEKPLSDMGLVSYRSYWRLVLCYCLLEQKESLSITDISQKTGMTADDIVCGLEGLRALVRDPITKTYALRLDYEFFKHYIESYESKGYVKINPDALIWVPYVMGKENSQYEHGPQLHTVAQRDDNLDNSFSDAGIQMSVNGVSTKDYAKDGEEVVLTASEILTPLEENDTLESELPVTPSAVKERNSSQENSQSDGAQTSYQDRQEKGQAVIPPTRFEVFPPLPGTILKKRTSRQFGRTTTRRGTPVRRGLSFEASPESKIKLASLRRPRSRLAESMHEATAQDEHADQLPESIEEAEQDLASQAEDSLTARQNVGIDTDMVDGELHIQTVE